MIKIVADENLAYAKDLFSQYGKVKLLNGRKITYLVLKDTDALIIRSITQVNKSLLAGTKVRFVGTATIGTDHLDMEYLKSTGIIFASAPGCNSYSVAEYVLASLLYTAIKNNFSLKDKSIGIVGIGNVGSKVVRFCEALGMKVLKNDPPLSRQGKLKDSVAFDDILETDIISLHVPLSFTGEDKTYHMLNEHNLRFLKHNSILINTSRGSVIDSVALRHINKEKNLTVISDVWENEPDIDTELLKRVLIGTPHIAGYTLEGKVNGSLMIYDALADFLKMDRVPNISLPVVNNNQFLFDSSVSIEESLNNIVKQIYNIEDDHSRLLEVNSMNDSEIGRYFDTLRKDYPLRREFNNYSIKMNKKDAGTEMLLRNLRFSVLS
ncbi:MAG TPA: 4-phosphoerythronate dehydrogenase [Ignavibacteriaceae bacterium]|nr:4-phosphoerythronate dehydrogenase [Ignavibacteriaceae bacterium]